MNIVTMSFQIQFGVKTSVTNGTFKIIGWSMNRSNMTGQIFFTTKPFVTYVTPLVVCVFHNFNVSFLFNHVFGNGFCYEKCYNEIPQSYKISINLIHRTKRLPLPLMQSNWIMNWVARPFKFA